MTQPQPLPGDPQPSDQDRANARLRRQVADRQAQEYAQVLAWAAKAFGPGWLPSHRHDLVDKDEEARCRHTGERPRAAATVYTVRQEETGEARHFTVAADGAVTECAGYQDSFGPMLREPHPTRGFQHQGQFCHYHRYSLCWVPYELYQPRTAEQLAALRAARGRTKAARAEKEWAAANPLLAWAEKVRQEDEAPEGGESRPVLAPAQPAAAPHAGLPDADAVARQIAAIQDRFGDDWHRSPQALAEASALWGGGHNDSGVFTNGEQETVAQSGPAEATVTVARSPAGLFAFGVNFVSPASGFGHAPRVWGRPFANREEARRAAIAELLAGLEEGAPAGAAGARGREDCQRIREQLRAQLRPRQRGLFD
jgi:hypothetical protein